MIVSLVRSYEEFLSLEDGWNSLWQSACPDNVFLHFDWIRSFIEAFDIEDRLYILVQRQEQQITAVLPLRIGENQVLQMLGAPRSDYADLICTDENFSSAVTGLFDFLFTRKDWRQLKISELSERSRLYQHRSELEKSGFYANWEASSRCPGIRFSEDGDVLTRLTGKKSLKRRENGLARHGLVDFRVLTSWEDIEPIIDVFFEQHIARWRMAGHESQYHDKSERKFCRLYLRRFLDTGLLHFSVLYCDDIAMAIHIGFETEKVFVWYKPTFDIQYKRLSPGEVLIKRLLEHCGAAEIEYFDFARGVEQFKRRFSNVIYRNFNLIVFARTGDQLWFRLKSVAVGRVNRVRRHLAKSGRQSPAVN